MSYHEDYDFVREAVLNHIQNVFQEIEAEAVMSHQEKYALLEDAFHNATDVGELKVAFDQWYSDHADDLSLEVEADELWDQAVSGEEGSLDSYTSDDDFDYEDEEEEEFEEDED